MITLGFVLENHFTTIHNCLLSLEPIIDLISSYYILRGQPEDLKTKDYIKTWAKEHSIEEIKKIDDTHSVFYIYGNERLLNRNLNLDFNDKYNVTVISEDYREVQNRVNGFLEVTDKTLDIVLEVMPEDPVEYSRKAINQLIYNLDNKVEDTLQMGFFYRKGGNNELALEKLQKHNGSKTFKYYNEIILSSNKDAKYIYEFNNAFRCLESYYYLVEFLLNKEQYELAYEQLKKGYTLYDKQTNLSVNSIKQLYNELALVLLNKLNKEQETINVLLELDRRDNSLIEKIERLYNVKINNKNDIIFNRKSTILDSGILVSDKLTIILSDKDIINKLTFTNSVDNYRLVLGEENGVFYGGRNRKLTLSELERFMLQPISIQKYLILHNNIKIDDIEYLKKQIIFIDINPNEESVNEYLNDTKLIKNIIYLGVSNGVIDNKYNEYVKDNQYLMISNSPIELLKDTNSLLKKIGINQNDVFIVKNTKSLTLYNENLKNIVVETGNSILYNAYLINLKERRDRWNYAEHHFSGVLNVERIDAVKETPGWVGCFKSHQRCLRLAKLKNMNTCLVVEDDCELFRKNKFIDEWNEVRNWLDNNLDKWDVYLGGCTNLKKEHIHEYMDKNLGLVRLEFSTTTHFTYYNKSMFDKLINYNVNGKKYTPLDLVIPEFAKGRILTKVPYIAKQRLDYSDIEGQIVNYEQMFKDGERTIYENVKEPIEKEKEKLLISPILMGGLGNRMFQLASAYGIADKQNKEVLVTSDLQNAHSNQDYFKNIFRKVKKADTVIQTIYKEPDNSAMTYNDIPNFESNTRMFGYYQNEQYFSSIKDKIVDLFEIENDRLERLKSKYNDLENAYFIHIRRGDFIGNNVHEMNLANYYSKSIEYINKSNDKAKYYVFSDDIEKCKGLEWLNNVNYSFVEESDEVDSLYLMTLCNRGGIACNSTFSWWGGYLNKNPNKLVIYPNKFINNSNEKGIAWSNSLVFDLEKGTFSFEGKKISIAISTYEANNKGHEFVKISLDKIKEQTYKNVEVVISDHSKDDKIKNVVEGYKDVIDIKYVRNEEKYGNISNNINKAIDSCTGDYIKVLFMDDYLSDSTSLQTIIDKMNNENKMWLVGSYVHTKDRQGMYNQIIPRWTEEIKQGKNTIGCPSGLTISSRVKERFDENVKWFMDTDYYTTLYSKYGEPVYLDKVTVVTLQHDNQVTNTDINDKLVETEKVYLDKKRAIN